MRRIVAETMLVRGSAACTRRGSTLASDRVRAVAVGCLGGGAPESGFRVRSSAATSSHASWRGAQRRYSTSVPPGAACTAALSRTLMRSVRTPAWSARERFTRRSRKLTAAAKKRRARRERQESGMDESVSSLASEFDDMLDGKGVRRTRQRSKATKRASRAVGYGGAAGPGNGGGGRRRGHDGRGAVRALVATLRCTVSGPPSRDRGTAGHARAGSI